MSAVNDKRAVADGMERPAFPPVGIGPCPDSGKHDQAVRLDIIGNAAFDVRQTFSDQRRPDLPALLRGKAERSEFVRIGAGACTDADDSFQDT